MILLSQTQLKLQIFSIITLIPLLKKLIETLNFLTNPFGTSETRSRIPFWLNPTDQNEISNNISLLDFNKSVGPNGIYPKILNLLEYAISCQLFDISNISFSSVVLPSIIKIAIVVPIHIIDSKIDFSSSQDTSL